MRLWRDVAMLAAVALLLRTDPAAARVSEGAASNDESAGLSIPTQQDSGSVQDQKSKSSQEMQEARKVEERAEDNGELGDLKNVHRLGFSNPVSQHLEDGYIDVAPVTGQDEAVEEGATEPVTGVLGDLELRELQKKYDIPLSFHDEVIKFVKLFTTTGRGFFERWLSRSYRWIPLERKLLAEEGAPIDLVYLSMIESGFSAYAYSPAKASGLWQFISSTGKMYNLRDDFWVDERRDPVKATRAAATFLKELHARFNDWYLAWAAYNAGPGGVNRAIARAGNVTRDFWQLAFVHKTLPRETQLYVPKILAAAIVAKNPEKFGFSDVERTPEFKYEEVEIPDAMELAQIARLAGNGVTTAMLQELNPALRRWCTPPAQNGKGYKIKLPPGTKAAFEANFAKLDEKDKLTFRLHVVKRGDTLAAVSKMYEAPEQAILSLNGLKSARNFSPGTQVIIPISRTLAQTFQDKPVEFHEVKPVATPPPASDAPSTSKPPTVAFKEPVRAVTPTKPPTVMPTLGGKSVSKEYGKSYGNPYTKPYAKPYSKSDSKAYKGRGRDDNDRDKGRKGGKKPDGKNKNLYVVQPGDTLFEVARRTGVSVPQLKRLNNINTLGFSSRLPAGKALKLAANAGGNGRGSSRDRDDDRRSSRYGRDRDDDRRSSRYGRDRNRDDDRRTSRYGRSRDRDDDRRSARNGRDRDDDRRSARNGRDRDDDRRSARNGRDRDDDRRSARNGRDRDDDRRSARDDRDRRDRDRSKERLGRDREREQRDRDRDRRDRDTRDARDSKGKDSKSKDAKGKDAKSKDSKGKDAKSKDAKGKESKTKERDGRRR